jgi:glycosyltransferase involved in cell wall biosynthesis
MRISVIIPVYNAAEYLREAVVSALSQPETGEVILVEDCSTDNSLEVCEQLVRENPKRVKLFRHPDGINRGPGSSRNIGIVNASCKYLAFLDADDYFVPGWFAQACEILETHPDADGVYGATGTYFESEDWRQSWFDQGNLEMKMVERGVEPDNLLEEYVKRRTTLFCLGALVVKREVFDKTGGFGSLRHAQDTLLILQMIAVARFLPGSIDKPVLMRRLHGQARIYQKPLIERQKNALVVWEQGWNWSWEERLPDKTQALFFEGLVLQKLRTHRGSTTIAAMIDLLRYIKRLISGRPGLIARRYFYVAFIKAFAAAIKHKLLRTADALSGGVQ